MCFVWTASAVHLLLDHGADAQVMADEQQEILEFAYSLAEKVCRSKRR